jgi:hypothetical protein
MYDCNSKVEICVTEIFFGHERVLIMSCYRSPLVVVEKREWKRFFEQIKLKFILASDLNAHHYQQGSTKNCVEGKHIYQCLRRRA